MCLKTTKPRVISLGNKQTCSINNKESFKEHTYTSRATRRLNRVKIELVPQVAVFFTKWKICKFCISHNEQETGLCKR